jgi:hypothetical protein
MKRITVWIDCEDGELEEALRRVEEALRSAGQRYAIVSIDPIRWPGAEK